jgi:hypothetical protein
MRIRIAIFAVLFFATALVVWAAVPTTLNDFFLPGSQPNQSGNLETPDKCDNCHGGYDIAVEPAFGWRGGMMSQAARDPLFYACLAISNQDAPESGDLCIRCHSPAGWLEGRSTPTDGSALNNNDREGVQCDFCHKLIKPTPLGVNPYPDDDAYIAETYDRDQTYLATLTDIPEVEADGMYIADNDNAKRGPFADANPTHQKFYSPFHSEANLCGTCHDVSNPAFLRESSGNYAPNSFDQPAPDFDPYTMFPIERTFSEWKMSEYNTSGVYAPQFGGNKDTVSTCQDCHMRDATGYGCNKSSAPLRNDLPLHDQTGGNTFIPNLVESLFPGETDPAALDSGIVRARYMLKNAASMNVQVTDQDTAFLAEVEVINETGHKLPSGYPEGRRIWLNVQAYNSNDDLIYESGAYDTATGILTHDGDAKIYEIKPGISGSLAPVVGLTAGVSFHFVLNDTIYSDNRIPPRGFTNANFEAIQSPPVGYSYPDGQYWDETSYYVPNTTSRLVVNLYYQTTSKEYVEFLRDENVTNDWGTTFYNLWASNGKSAPELMNTDTIYLSPVAQNHPPVLDSIGPKATDENVNLNFTVTASDPDGTIPDLTTSTLPDGAAFTDHNDGTATFDWTPDYTQADIYSITFYATDDSSAVDSEAVEITVNNINQDPVLDSIGPKSTDENVSLNFTVTASDPDGTIPDLTTSTLPDGAAFTDHNDGTATFDWTPDYAQADIYSVIFYATDDSSAVDSEAVEITVNNINRAPVLDSIGPQTVPEADTLTLIITATDPDGDSLSFSADPVPTNAELVDNGDNTATFTFIPDYTQAGDYTVVFGVSDGDSSDSESVLITVSNTNRPPTLAQIGSQNVGVGDNLGFDVSASDPDGDSIILSTSTLPTGADFTDNGDGTGSFSWTPSSSQAGIHEITFFAEDIFQAQDSEVVEITVYEGNQPPVLDPIGNKNGMINQLITFTVTSSDPDGDSVSLSAENLPSGATFNDNGWDSGLEKYKGTFEWTPNDLQGGVYENIRFIASDGELSDDEFITITIESYVCADANSDGTVNVSDAVWIINYVFVGGDPPDPLASGDANCDDTVNVSDAVYIINYVFVGGSPPCDTNNDGVPDC